MPILGSSTVNSYGNGGPTGDTGPVGNRGNTGNTGVAAGLTGATGPFIQYVISDRNTNSINFIDSTGVSRVLSGFTGPTGSVYNIDGVSAAKQTTYFTPFTGATGFTFYFYGISGGTAIAATVSSGGTKIILTYNPGRDPYTKTSTPEYVPFIQMDTSVGTTGVVASKIYVDTSNILNFGLTGIPSGITLNKLFTNISEQVYTVTDNGSISTGGITLDLTQGYSNYWLPDPIGITAFIANTTSGKRQEYTLFFEGQNVWNLPKNLYLENSTSGVKYGGFVKGLNVLHIWSDNGGTTFNGVFLERGLGSLSPYDHYNMGSCCKAGTCEDNKTKEYCDSISGSFRALTTCESRKDSGESACGPSKSLKSAAITGACCCGATGCLDASNVPAGTDVTETFCRDTLKGKFYAGLTCYGPDKHPNYNYLRDNDVMYGGGITPVLCHTCGGVPSACCRPDGAGGYTCSQETYYHCMQIGGSPQDGKLCSEINCQDLLQTGDCRTSGACVSGKTKAECEPCGKWYTTGSCVASGITGILNTITTQPSIKIIHSIQNNVSSISYSLSKTEPAVLKFSIDGPAPHEYKLGAELEILDTGIARTIDIFDNPDPCLSFTITQKPENTPILKNSIINKASQGSWIEITISVDTSTGVCSLDPDFKGKLKLKPISCVEGAISTAEKQIDLLYTSSPCTCLTYANGDVVNKNPIIVPFSAERYCTHCTTAEVNLGSNIAHVPYPLKRQTGLLTFCPPTGVSGSECGIISSFCVAYSGIEELSGCTYSSRFDSNGDCLIYPGITAGDYNSNFDESSQTSRGTFYNLVENNTMPPGCYHAEYNAPGSGTTYFHKYDPQEAFYPEEIEFARQWFAANSGEPNDVPVDDNGNDIPITRSQFETGTYAVHHIRPFSGLCKRVIFPLNDDCDNKEPFDYSTCSAAGPSIDNERYSLNVITNPGQAGNWLSALNGRGGIQRLLSSPYYNIIKFDDDALIHLAKQYNIEPVFLQNRLYRELKKYGKLFDPTYNVSSINHIQANTAISSSPGFSELTAEQQNMLLIDPLADFGGAAIDVDDKARAGCTACASFFNDSTKIQIPKTASNDITSASGANYYAYGLVLEKIKQCTIDRGITADSDAAAYCGCARVDGDGPGQATQCPGCLDEVNKYCQLQKETTQQIKYYVVILRKPKTGSAPCIMVYDLAEQQIIYSGNLNNNNFGSVFCRGGDVICPLDCDIPTKIKEAVWLGDLTTNSINASGNCTDTVAVSYMLKNISKTYTGFDNYQYTSITDQSFFKINNLNKPAGVESSRMVDFSNISSKIFCRTATTDYITARCPLCVNDNCYSDIIPKLIEFIGQGCSVQGFNCSGTPTIEQIGVTFVNGTYDLAKSFVTTVSGAPVYWLIESYYNTSQPGLTITQPLVSTGIVPYRSNTYLDNCGEFYNNSSIGYTKLDSRFYRDHNICYLYVSDGKIKLSKNIESAGITAYLTIPDNSTGQEWHPGDEDLAGDPGTGVLYYNNIQDDIGGCAAYVFGPMDSSGNVIEPGIPKLNVNGYRPSITVDDLTVVKNSAGTKIRIKFKALGSYIKNSGDYNQEIANNDLNIKILKLQGSSIVDATRYYTGSDLIDTNIHDIENNYVFFDVETKIAEFTTDVTAGKLYILTNVNNSSSNIDWTATGLRGVIYAKKYKQYSPEADETTDIRNGDGLKLLIESSWSNSDSYLGDFDLKQLKQITVGGSFITAPPIETRKNVDGRCINIDCTAIGEVCDSLEGC